MGPKEARAWTVEKGSKAPRAAGEIHTDFERGFIRAETIAYDDYIALDGEAGAPCLGSQEIAHPGFPGARITFRQESRVDARQRNQLSQ